MLDLLAVELAKLWPSREVRVSLAVYAVLVGAALLALRALAFELPGAGTSLSLLAFPEVWHNAAYVAGWIDYLLYVLALQLVTQEYQFHTNRQQVIDGLGRGRYVAGKLTVMAGLALGSAVLVALLAAVAGLATGDAPSDGGAAAFVPLYALQTLGYLMLALLVATIVRRTGVAVLVFVGYTLAAEPLLRALALPAPAARLLPSAAFAALVPNPFFAYAGMRVTSSLPHAALVSAIYVCLFGAATRWVFGRQDL